MPALLTVVLLSLWMGPLWAAPQRVLIEKENLKPLNVFEIDPSKAPPRRGGLLELKWLELKSRWIPCRDLAGSLKNKNPELAPWISRTQLHCGMKAVEGGAAAGSLGPVVDAVKLNWLFEGPWKTSLLELWVKAQFVVLEDEVTRQPARGLKRADQFLKSAELLSKESRARVYELMGDASLKAKNQEQALYYWRLSQELQKKSALTKKIEEISPEAKASALAAAPAGEEPAPQPLGAERETELEVEKLLASGRRVEAVRQLVFLLRRFPAGESAERTKDKILVQYLLAKDQTRLASEAADLLEIMKTADASHLSQWASILHRRMDLPGGLALAEQALETWVENPASTSLWWIVGRSALFMGQMEKAQRAFDQLVQFHAATDEAAEAQFRLGLIQIRQGNWVTAARLFENVLQRGKPRFELGAMYWRVRALEMSKSDQAAAVRDELLARFPFTYYGLKLRAEKNGGILEFPKNERSPLEASVPKIWLTGAQKDAWSRFRQLSAEGWILEAQNELTTLPHPQDSWSLLRWARLMAKSAQHPLAILLTTKAMDGEASLRHPRYLESALPQAYEPWIKTESEKNGLDPILVRSLIRQESAFGLRAVSSSNALGLMQMIPPTAQDVARSMKLKVAIPDDLFRPEINVPMGTFYLSQMLKTFNGHVPLAVAAYNAGPSRLQIWIAARPELANLPQEPSTDWQKEIWFDELPWSETSFYVKAILRNILLYRLVETERLEVKPAFWTEMRVQTAMTR